MSLRDAYQEKLEAQWEEQRARMALLKAKAKRLAADGKIMAYEELGDADAKLQEMKKKLKEFGNTSQDAWKEMKGGLDKAWQEVNSSCKRAADRFKDKEPKA